MVYGTPALTSLPSWHHLRSSTLRSHPAHRHHHSRFLLATPTRVGHAHRNIAYVLRWVMRIPNLCGMLLSTTLKMAERVVSPAEFELGTSSSPLQTTNHSATASPEECTAHLPKIHFQLSLKPLQMQLQTNAQSPPRYSRKRTLMLGYVAFIVLGLVSTWLPLFLPHPRGSLLLGGSSSLLQLLFLDLVKFHRDGHKTLSTTDWHSGNHIWMNDKVYHSHIHT
ncbi:hypothetical protein GWK47_002048 [Chionoecetes opilio]|uniref:Uncharacterized protein n=1 Tax=Chionoecetes opilio TaxID=41210 RepID=A0A8J5CJH9_CHIOP|nr:hypothetical protein GWK47_002048 [Chionoecetes opilio]